MKLVDRIGTDLDVFSKKFLHNLIQAQRDTAEKIQTDARNYSPKPEGEYAQSIKVDQTEVAGEKISTWIHTDMKSEDGHFIGRMIEYGTGIYALEPRIAKTTTYSYWSSGMKYWYVPTDKVKRPIGQKININGVDYYVAHAQRPKPHFKPALYNNIYNYKENISQAVRRSK